MLYPSLDAYRFGRINRRIRWNAQRQSWQFGRPQPRLPPFQRTYSWDTSTLAIGLDSHIVEWVEPDHSDRHSMRVLGPSKRKTLCKYYTFVWVGPRSTSEQSTEKLR